MSGKLKVEVTHPSFNDYRLGQVLVVTEEQLNASERLRACTRPYVPNRIKQLDLTVSPESNVNDESDAGKSAGKSVAKAAGKTASPTDSDAARNGNTDGDDAA